MLVPLLPDVNRRIAPDRAGPSSTAALEPPALAGLNSDARTPLVSVAAHLAYGVALGLLVKGR